MGEYLRDGRIPERWGADLRDGEQSREMGSRHEIWGADQRDGEEI
jgi:hypothetical protein